MTDRIRVAEAARALGCSERWLRDAEKRGAIAKAKRDINSWRYYTPDDLAKIASLICPNGGDHDVQ